jgi:hypothetical protein
VTRDLTGVFAFSLLVALLTAAASLLGLLLPDRLYPSEDLQQSFLVNDVINLVIGLPALLGSIWSARRGQLLGLLFWPGALFYVVYNSIIYAFALPLTVGFLLSSALLILSIYTMVSLLVSIDAGALRQQIGDTIPARQAGGILIGLGTLFVVLAFGTLVGDLLGSTAVSPEDLAVHFSDIIIGPAWMLVGLLLWRREPLGYVAGTGLLFQASLLFVGLIGFLLLQPVLTGAPFAPGDILVIFILGLTCFVPLALFIRGILRRA